MGQMIWYLFRLWAYLYRELLLILIFIISLTLLRMGLGRSLYPGFLLWNVFLAVIPLLLAHIAYWLPCGNYSSHFKKILWLLCLLFLPNASYLLTDLKHLTTQYHPIKWLDLILFFGYAMLGLLVHSKVTDVLTANFIGNKKMAIVSIINLLCGIGLYLGRISRLNSWDAFISPQTLFMEIAQGISKIEFWIFTLVYGGALTLFYSLKPSSQILGKTTLKPY